MMTTKAERRKVATVGYMLMCLSVVIPVLAYTAAHSTGVTPVTLAVEIIVGGACLALAWLGVTLVLRARR